MIKYISLLLCILTGCVSQKVKLVEPHDRYFFKTDHTEMQMILNDDSTYTFTVSKYGKPFNSKGHWRTEKDTIFLDCPDLPYKIDSIVEITKKLKSDDFSIEVSIVDSIDNDMPKIRSHYKYYIWDEGKNTNVIYHFHQKKFSIFDFRLWVDERTARSQLTDNMGMAVFKLKQPISVVNGDFFQYQLQDPSSNYLKIYIEKYPNIELAELMKYKKWIINKNSIIPFYQNKCQENGILYKPNTIFTDTHRFFQEEDR